MIDQCVLVVPETTSEQETRDLDHLVICRCKKHRQLSCQVGAFVVCFPLNVPIVHSSTLTVGTNRERLMCGGFSLGETVCFGSLEFIIYYFGGLSLSPGRRLERYLCGNDPQQVAIIAGHDRGLPQ
jgi:hypothetical protein